MIITCPLDNKKFEIDADLIPKEGRNLQCGSCGHVWFYKKEIPLNRKNVQQIKKEKIDHSIKINKSSKNNLDQIPKKALVKFEDKSSFTVSKFLSYLIVLIISFGAVLILVDTFKSIIYDLFPSLEHYLFNFFEILKDIKLFVNDLL